MKKIVPAFLILALLGSQTAPGAAQPSARAGEGVAPAAVGQPCTAPHALRGAQVAAPRQGDVATVPQLCAGGVSAERLPRTPQILPPASTVSDAPLGRDQSLPGLVAIGAPESSGVDIRTLNGNWTHLFSGAFWRAPSITTHGELQAVDTGHASFSVAAALGYFAVVMPRFLARVKGTIFDVDYEPGKTASFSVSEGSVAIVRLVTVHLQEENRSYEGVRQTDIISATGKNSISYQLPPQTLQFKNLNEAEHYFEQQLQAATTEGDPQLVDDSINNIQLVTGKTIAPLGANVGVHAVTAAGAANPVLLPAIAFAAAAAAVGAIAASSGSKSTPVPQSTPTGTVTLQSRTHTTASSAPVMVRVSAPPVASPTPTPSASPRPQALPAPLGSPHSGPPALVAPAGPRPRT